MSTSHIKAINQFYSDGFQYAVILEDDFSFEYVKYKDYSLMSLTNYSFDILQLGYIQYPGSIQNALKRDTPISKGYYWSTVGYLITRSGAKKCLDYVNNQKNFLGPADHSIYRSVETYMLNQPYITYLTNHTSTIHESHKSLHISSKETITKFYEDRLPSSSSAFE